jgi:hypothetical protein
MDSECLNIFKQHISYWNLYPPPPVYFSDKPYAVKDIKPLNIELWVSIYNSPRNSEVLSALDLNLKNPSISKINILLEESKLKLSRDIVFNPKVSIILLKKGWRTKFSDIIGAIPISSSNINIILNSDIVLSYSELYKIQKIDKNDLIVLSRYEISDNSSTIDEFIQTGKLIDNCASSDVWIFKGHPNVVADIYMGIPGCENMLIMDFVRKNYDIYNLGKIIPSYHLHRNKNGNNSYPFTYFLSKNFNITFVKLQSNLKESTEDPINSTEPTDMENAIENITEVFNNEFKQYKLLSNLYTFTLNSTVENIKNDLVKLAKSNVEKELSLFFNDELSVRREALDRKLETDEKEFSKQLKESLEEKFNLMYSEEFELKKKSLHKKLLEEEGEFKKKLISSQAEIIDSYKNSKFFEIDTIVKDEKERLLTKVKEDVELAKNEIKEKLSQEIAIKTKENIQFLKEQDIILSNKRAERVNIHIKEIDMLQNDIKTIQTQIEELHNEEKFLREKNASDLVKIDEECEKYKLQTINEANNAINSIKDKITIERDLLEQQINENAIEVEKAQEKFIIENKKEIEQLQLLFNDKKAELNESHTIFCEELKQRKKSAILSLESEILSIKTERINKIQVEIDHFKQVEHENAIQISNEIKSNIEGEITLIMNDHAAKKKAILIDIAEYKEFEYAKIRNEVNDYSIEYKNKMFKTLAQDYEEQKMLKDRSLEQHETQLLQEIKIKVSEYENVLLKEVEVNISNERKKCDNLLEGYVQETKNKIKLQYSQTLLDKETAINYWNEEYKLQQKKITDIRVEHADIVSQHQRKMLDIQAEHADIIKQHDIQMAIKIEDSTNKIKESIEIFNSQYKTRDSAMKSKLLSLKNTVIAELEEMRKQKLFALDEEIKDKNAIFAKEQTLRNLTRSQQYAEDSQKIKDEVAELRSEEMVKLYSEINEKRIESENELIDELKTFRETQIESIRNEIEVAVMAKFQKTIEQRDAEDKRTREEEHKQFKEYIDGLRKTEIENIQSSKEATIGRLDVRIVDLRKQLFEIEKAIRDAQK